MEVGGGRWGPCVALSPSECRVSAETALVTDELHIPAVTPESQGALSEPIPKTGEDAPVGFRWDDGV